METGLMEIVGALNISWIYDTYFSLYRAILPGKNPGGNVREEMSRYHNRQRTVDRHRGCLDCINEMSTLGLHHHA